MIVVGSINRHLRIVPQVAAGVMTLEPLLNNVGARLRQQTLEVANTPLKTVNIAQTGQTSDATIVLECSNDGENWVEVASLIGSGSLVNNEAWALARIRVSAYTDGEISGSFHGTA